MSYKRSTSFTGYRARNTLNTESKDLVTKAKALDKQRVDNVKGMSKQASDQITEMNRLSNLEAKADAYEIKNLAKFSKSLNDAIQIGAKTLGVEYIRRKRQEAYDDYRNAEAGDEEAKKKVALNTEQLTEIETKIKELETEKNRALSGVEANNIRMSMEDRFKIENAKKYGSNYAYGYQKASLMEGAKGFMPWFQATINDSKEKVTLPDGREIEVKEYSSLTTSADRKTVEDKLLLDYEERTNQTDLSNVVVNQVLRKSVTQQLQKWRTVQLDQEIKDNAQNNISKGNIDIHQNISLFERGKGQEDLIEKSIQHMFTNGRAFQISAGATKNAGGLNKTGIKDTIIDALASVDDDVLRVELANKILDEMTFDIPGVNKGSLSDPKLFGNMFDKEQILVDIEYKIDKNIEKKEKVAKKTLAVKINQAQYDWSNGGNKLEYFGLMDSDELKQLALQTPDGMNMLARARTYKMQKYSYDQGKRLADAEKEKYNGKITQATWMKLSTELQEEYGMDSVADGDMFHETKLGKDFYKALGEDSLGELNLLVGKIAQGNDQLGLSASEIDNAQDFIVNEYIHTVVNDLKNNPNIPSGQSEEFYHKEARKVILSQIRAGRKEDDYRTNPFATAGLGQQQFDDKGLSNGVFLNPRFNNTTELSSPNFDVNSYGKNKQIMNTELRSIRQKIVNSSNTAKIYEDKDLLGKLTPNLKKQYLMPNLDKDGNWNEESAFVQYLTYMDPQKRDSFTIGNILRETHFGPEAKIDKSTLPENIQTIITTLENSDQKTRELLSSPYAHDRARGIDMIGLVDGFTMGNAMDNMGFTVENIKPAALADILTKLEKSKADFDANADGLQAQVFKVHTNNLIKKATQLTDNKYVAIQMVGIAFNGGNMQDYGQPNVGSISKKTLNNYYGAFENNDGLTDDYALVSVDGKDTKTLTTMKVIPPVVTVERLDTELTKLNENKPPERLATTGRTKTKKNPDYIDYLENVSKLEARKDMLALLQSDEPIQWGQGRALAYNDPASINAWYGVQQAMGKTRYNKFLKQLNLKFIKETNNKISPISPGYNLTLVGGKKIKKDWSNFVKENLLKTPEFYTP